VGEVPGVFAGVHDLRGSGPGWRLRYPPGDVLVVSGLPGSGKSTLIREVAAVGRLDSQDSRAGLARRLPRWLPYGVYRPLARAVHFWRLRQAVRAGGSLVVHDCGARPWVRGWLGRAVRRQGRKVHLLLLDVPAAEALDGQLARGRTVSGGAFARHLAAWARLVASVESAAGGGALPGGAASVVLVDREALGGAGAVGFGPAGRAAVGLGAAGPGADRPAADGGMGVLGGPAG
jgi:predicted kinase